MSLLSLVLGIAFIGAGLWTVLADRRRRAEWQVHPGRVVASRLDDGKIRFRVSYTWQGREVSFWNRYSVTVDPVGKDVEVLVNPEDPEDAVVSRGLASGTALGVAMVAFGVLALLVGTPLGRVLGLFGPFG
jgi:hypothetical protein